MNIFKTLDKWFGKDDMTTTYNAWKEFKEFERKTDDTIETFLSSYDKKVKELQKQGVKLPEVILGMQLLDSAKLDVKEKQIVLTAVNYDEQGQIYEQMKRAIRKFIGNNNIELEQKQIKQEVFETQYDEDERAYMTGFRNNYRGRRMHRGAADQNYRGGGFRQGYRSDTRGGNDIRGRGTGRGTFVRRRWGDKNPKDDFGNFLKCTTCESIMHFRKYCPHNKQEAYQCAADDEREVKEAYKIEYSQEENQILMTETVHAAVLDSACSKTVAGREWQEMFLASLSEKEKIKRYPTKSTYFKFGSGERVVSNETMEIPCMIAGVPRTIKTKIVNSDIPLLLSKPDMKKMGFKINLENDTLETNGVTIDLDTTSSGHNYIPLKECEVKIEQVNLITDLKSLKEKEKVITKLHRQFGHPSDKSLKDILINAEAFDKECGKIIEDISKNCDVCKRYKKKLLHDQ